MPESKWSGSGSGGIPGPASSSAGEVLVALDSTPSALTNSGVSIASNALFPDADASINLGTASKRFLNGFLRGTLTFYDPTTPFTSLATLAGNHSSGHLVLTGTLDSSAGINSLTSQIKDELRLGDSGGSGHTGSIRVAGGNTASNIAGSATLVAGTVVVPNTLASNASLIFLTPQVGSSVSGTLSVTAAVVNTSFTITSTNLADTGPVSWLLITLLP